MSFGALLIDTVDVLRVTYTQSATGATVKSTPQVIGTYKARAWRSGAQKKVAQGGQAEVSSWVFDFPANTDILPKDTLRVGATEYEAETVESVNGASSAHHVQVTAQLVKR